MGAHLSELAARAGYKVVVTSRTRRSEASPIRYVCGNARDNGFLASLLQERWDVVVDFMVYSTAEFAARRDLLLANTDQYVFLSSSRVYAASESPLCEDSARLLDVCEDLAYLATDEYALAKARQEDLLAQSNLRNWTIIRPYITYSEQRLQLGVMEKEAWLYRALRGRSIVLSREIASRQTTLTYGLDVSRGILAVMGGPRCHGEAYHITASQSATWGEVLGIYTTILAKHLGRLPRVCLIDHAAFCTAHHNRYQISYDRMYDRIFDNEKIGSLVDTGSFVELKRGLSECLLAFLTRPVFASINWKEEAHKDRRARERTPLREVSGLKQRLKYLSYRYVFN